MEHVWSTKSFYLFFAYYISKSIYQQAAFFHFDSYNCFFFSILEWVSRTFLQKQHINRLRQMNIYESHLSNCVNKNKNNYKKGGRLKLKRYIQTLIILLELLIIILTFLVIFFFCSCGISRQAWSPTLERHKYIACVWFYLK